MFVLLTILLFLPLQNAFAEKVFFAGYKGGFYIRSEEDGGMELRLGGALQTDYRYYAEEEIRGWGQRVRHPQGPFAFQGAVDPVSAVQDGIRV